MSEKRSRATEALLSQSSDELLKDLYLKIKEAAQEKGSGVYGLPPDDDDVWS